MQSYLCNASFASSLTVIRPFVSETEPSHVIAADGVRSRSPASQSGSRAVVAGAATQQAPMSAGSRRRLCHPAGKCPEVVGGSGHVLEVVLELSEPVWPERLRHACAVALEERRAEREHLVATAGPM